MSSRNTNTRGVLEAMWAEEDEALLEDAEPLPPVEERPPPDGLEDLEPPPEFR